MGRRVEPSYTSPLTNAIREATWCQCTQYTAEAEEALRMGAQIEQDRATFLSDRDVALDALRQLLTLLTDPETFWNAVHPHITEAGPDLNFSDCEAITDWLTTSLGGLRESV